MDKNPQESDSKVFDFSKFKKRGGSSLYEERKIESAPNEFREFPYKSSGSDSLIDSVIDKDDIIGDLLNEFSDDLKETKYHEEDKSLHFFELRRSEILNEEDNFDEILSNLDSQLKQLQDNCSRVKFLVSEIENQIQD